VSKRKEAEPTSWILTVKCTVTKSVVVEGCTEEQAQNDPWQYATNEHEVEMSDWEVTRTEPNE
jgi:hypothetical protein